MAKHKPDLAPEELEMILAKLNILKEAMSLPPTTQEDILEIARKILDSVKAKKR